MQDERCKDCTPSTLCAILRKDIDEIKDNNRVDMQAVYTRLNTLDSENSSLRTDLKNLCEQIKGLVSTLRYATGIILTVVSILIAILRK